MSESTNGDVPINFREHVDDAFAMQDAMSGQNFEEAPDMDGIPRDKQQGDAPDGVMPESVMQDSEELLQLRRDNEYLVEQLRQSQADFRNYKRRSEQQVADAQKQASGKILASFISVLDNVEAMRNAGDLTGPFASIMSRLEQVLAEQGLVKHGELGETFDPTLHEAVFLDDKSEYESNTISHVVLHGYTVNMKVVRAAQVVVAA